MVSDSPDKQTGLVTMELQVAGATLKLESKLGEQAYQFLERLTGPAATELGLMWGDKARYYRYRNQVRLLIRAREMLEKAGLAANHVPLRTLLPLLEGAATEDDESLSEKWAALLAN